MLHYQNRFLRRPGSVARWLVASFLALSCMISNGCGTNGGGRAGQAADLAAIMLPYGTAEQLTATLRLKLRRPAGQSSPTFTADVWIDRDNQMRLQATKLGVEFLDALIAPDQQFTALLVRDNEVISGSLSDSGSGRRSLGEPGPIRQRSKIWPRTARTSAMERCRPTRHNTRRWHGRYHHA